MAVVLENPIVWLAGGLLAGIGAYLLAWPTWREYRAREARRENADRYLRWRGRAPRGSAAAPERLTSGERRRLWIAGGLAAVGAFCLVGLFTYA